jgi:Rab GDP dissociation inhibitor
MLETTIDTVTANLPPSTSKLFVEAFPNPRAITNTTPSYTKKYGNYKTGEEVWKKWARANDWNIDLVPKLLMANGELTNILVSTGVTRCLEFRQIAGSYVQQGSGPRATVAKVPSSASEALSSSLMGIFEKRRAKGFLEWVGSFDVNNTSIH